MFHRVHPDSVTIAFFLIAVGGASILASFYISWTGVIALLFVAACFAAAYAQPRWGLYALAAAAPAGAVMIDIAQSETFSKIPYLGTVYAPLVDIIAIGLLVICALLFVYRRHELALHARGQQLWLVMVWLLAVGLSAYAAWGTEFGTIAAKAFARPYLFAFVGFALPVIVLARTRRDVVRVLIAYEAMCLLGAFMGVASLALIDGIGFLRVTPFTIFGITPFGTNHNVLAEALIAIIPFAFYWTHEQRRTRYHGAWFAAALLITTVSLATASRAAWIAVAFQIVCFVLYALKWSKKKLAISAALLGCVAAFFFWIQSTAIAESSDATRIDLLEIAATYFMRAPWLGIGPGTFVPLVSETRIFGLEYGDALDAHGFLEKMLPEIGLIGTVAFCAILMVLLWQLWKRRRDPFLFMLFVTIASMWVFQLFNTGYFAGKVWILMGCAFAALLL